MSLLKIYICDICGRQEHAITDLEEGYDEWWPNKWIGLEDDKHACVECVETIPISKTMNEML